MTGREAAFARILRRRQIKNDTALVTFGDEKGSNGEKTTIRLILLLLGYLLKCSTDFHLTYRYATLQQFFRYNYVI